MPKLTLPTPAGPVWVLNDVCAGQAEVSYFHLLVRAMKKNISGLQTNRTSEFLGVLKTNSKNVWMLKSFQPRSK